MSSLTNSIIRQGRWGNIGNANGNGNIGIGIRQWRQQYWGQRGRRLLSSSGSFPWLNSPTPRDVDAFFQCMNHREGSVMTDPAMIEDYNTDWNRQYKGKSTIVLRPKTTAEISAILRHCNETKVGIVPQGGNTGLVGGSIPIHDEVILSIRGLNDIEGLDQDTGILKSGAGCILKDLQDYAADRHHMVPVDLGAKGSCCIGGNVATNAGGQYFYRYGSLHANVLGLEVVLPDGRILDLMSSVNLKDNTGYDLKHLFIGAEGTLGVITRVALQCPHLPSCRNTTFLACKTFGDVQRTLRLAKQTLGEIMAAFEFMDGPVLNMVATQLKLPLTQDDGSSYPYCILVETQGSHQEHDAAKMELFLEQAMSTGCVVDGVLAHDLHQVHSMWSVRESCNPIILSKGYVFKYDISLPIRDFPDLIAEMKGRLSGIPTAQVVNWGHVVDGNLHLNVVIPGSRENDPAIKARIEPFIFESVVRRGGSISAEHGLGQSKNNYLPLAKTKTALELMTTMKSIFDPNCILNPGKYLPSTS
jgi:FAD/FMN-containing dehydrogenase